MDPTGFCVTDEVTGSSGSVSMPRISSTVESANFSQNKSSGTGPPAALPKLEVEFHNGLLRIVAENITLKETLKAVSAHIMAEVQFPLGALDDHIFVNLGPGAPQEIVSQLLKGSGLNYLMLSSNENPGGMTRLILTKAAPDPNAASSITSASPSDDTAAVQVYGTFVVDPNTASEEPTNPQPAPGAQSATAAPNWVHHDSAVLSGEQLDQIQKSQLQQEQQQFAQELEQERQRQKEQGSPQQ